MYVRIMAHNLDIVIRGFCFTSCCLWTSESDCDHVESYVCHLCAISTSYGIVTKYPRLCII